MQGGVNIVTRKINVTDVAPVMTLFGQFDENLSYLNRILDVKINTLGGELTVCGEQDKVERAVRVVGSLLEQAKKDGRISKATIDLVTEAVDSGNEHKLEEVTKVVTHTAKGKPIRAKTYGQAVYVEAIGKSSVVFGIGPAGRGKTYLAVALAALAYKNKEVEKIILTRPAVEAGEKLGFLPGDLGAKVDPYLRPLYDALQEMFGLETFNRLVEKGSIEIAPLAYMRGRTLSNAFIILDEAQNATREQMKMFLTRMGEGSKIVVTGDVTQIDLPREGMSGLIHASEILVNIPKIAIIRLTAKDVVRHPLVQAIVSAYDKAERARAEKEAEKEERE